ncbi:hypothetical protein FOMG_17723 [Fusarium oxysporum f. sp. melonis 26406]|uniref:Uncharacterized protein n=1 Tax=Fusarium oxysporum f. sp. melonis 26406 TaxID=1089452 RepID=W9ZAK7_FUSOX|nr:hypothetical protein FOMG_17723 [Fusarium oxysporum f. sp. melonis 26406]
MLWHTALLKGTAWRFYLFFCIQCYGRLRQSHRFAEAIGRSLISMALQKGGLSANEARRIMQQFEEERLSKPSEDIRATFIADLNLAMTDPQEASVESLAYRFEDIALFREFINEGLKPPNLCHDRTKPMQGSHEGHLSDSAHSQGAHLSDSDGQQGHLAGSSARP